MLGVVEMLLHHSQWLTVVPHKIRCPLYRAASACGCTVQGERHALGVQRSGSNHRLIRSSLHRRKTHCDLTRGVLAEHRGVNRERRALHMFYTQINEIRTINRCHGERLCQRLPYFCLKRRQCSGCDAQCRLSRRIAARALQLDCLVQTRVRRIVNIQVRRMHSGSRRSVGDHQFARALVGSQ